MRKLLFINMKSKIAHALFLYTFSKNRTKWNIKKKDCQGQLLFKNYYHNLKNNLKTTVSESYISTWMKFL